MNKVYSAATTGLEAELIEVEAERDRGAGPDRRSRDRCVAAGRHRDGLGLSAARPQRRGHGQGGRVLALRRYTVWSYAPRPTPAELVQSAPEYPLSLSRFLDVGRPSTFRIAGPCGSGRVHLHRHAISGATAVPRHLARRASTDREVSIAVRGHGRDRALATIERRLRL